MTASVFLMAIALPFLASSSTRQAAPFAGPVSLTTLRGSSRPLLLFAPKPDDPQLEIQMRRLNEGVSTLAERDVVVIALPWDAPSTTAAQLSNADALAARRRFHIGPTDFAVILLGKDGGEKLRSSKPLTVEKIRDTIDAMPMRQDEMRTRKP